MNRRSNRRRSRGDNLPRTDTAAKVSLHAASGHIAPGSRAKLVDAATRSAGSTALVDATVPSDDDPQSPNQP
jgi:hypothetical protein